ncbi:DUF305 domain-containing protein [Luethyella okanaganae]|uniref:DUF305 domain-containing protein n=1 Tax=Luethyella okanaganae TaxID=69372 RepID=A0ABW1VHK8_9MICO
MINARKTLTAAVALATALTLGGCAGGMTGMNMGGDNTRDGSSPGANDGAVFENADVMFAQMMIPHHEQAVEMSDVLLAKGGVDARIRDLANQIKNAQQPEIDQLKQWLSDWGQDESAMPGMNHGGSTMSDDDMTALDDATEAEAGRLFLEQMIVHHHGAVAMAQDEVDNGANADAKAMAENIIATQTDEIALMQELLASV